MNNLRTIDELTSEEYQELKIILLFSDDEQFYEDIDEITDESVIAKFGSMTFKREDFSCNFVA